MMEIYQEFIKDRLIKTENESNEFISFTIDRDILIFDSTWQGLFLKCYERINPLI